MNTLKKPMGRPLGRDYPVIKQVRLGTQDAALLTALADAWRCSEAAAIRRAIAELAKREKVTVEK